MKEARVEGEKKSLENKEKKKETTRRDAPRAGSDTLHRTKERAKRESRADRDERDGDRHHETDARARMTRRARTKAKKPEVAVAGLGSLGCPMISERSRASMFAETRIPSILRNGEVDQREYIVDF